jgi:hypothetical protein
MAVKIIFSETAKHAAKSEKAHTGKYAAAKLLWLGALVGLTAILTLDYSYWYNKRTIPACSRAASADVAKLSAAIERLGNETIDLNCELKPPTGDQVPYLVGPYYGWGGTNERCQVLIRVRGDEVWSCALRGASPEGPETRYIYRIRLDGGADLPITRGPCQGRAYGGPEQTCYTEGIVKNDCSLRTPKGIKCRKAWSKE